MNGKEFLRKLQFVVMIALGSYPVTVAAALFFMPGLLPYSWIYPLCFGLIGIAAMAVPGIPRLILTILGMLAFTAPSFVFFSGTTISFVLVVGAAFSILLLCTLRIGGWEAGKELPAGWLACIFVFLLIGCFLSFVEPKVAHTALPMRLSLFVFLFFAMLSLNRGSLFLAAGGKRSFSPAMIGKNILLTVSLFGIALAVALLPSLWELIKQLFGWLGQLITWLKELFASLIPEETYETGATTFATEVATTGEGLGVITEKIPRREASAAEQIMMTSIVLAVVIPAAIFGIYKLSRLLIKGIRKLISMVDAAAHAQTEDYEDEITDTRQDGQSETRRGKREKKERIPERDLAPGDWIRYRYRQLSKKHPEWQAHNTARENLPDSPAQLYERARYSDHTITPEEAEQFKIETK